MIKYEYELNTIWYGYTSNKYMLRGAWYNTIILYYAQKNNIIIFGQP